MTTGVKCSACIDEGSIRGPRMTRGEGNALIVAMLFVAALVTMDTVGGFVSGGAAVVSAVVFLGVFLKLVPFFWRQVIGRTVYLFLDKEGDSHIHRHDPYARGTTPGLKGNRLRYPEGAVLQVRIGGWFRKNKVISLGTGRFWKISHAWNGLDDLRVRDGSGSELRIEWLPDLLKTINRFADVRQIFNALELAEGVRDHLGKGIVSEIAEIEADRARLGRSEHAKKLRVHLGEWLSGVPRIDVQNAEKLIRRWREEVAADRAVATATAATSVAPADPAAADRDAYQKVLDGFQAKRAGSPPAAKGA